MPLALAALWSLVSAGPPAAPLPLPEAALVARRDVAGCSTVAFENAPKQCVREALAHRLDDPDEIDVALRVTPRGRDRIFIYHLVGARLVPRFLGSGPSSLEVLGLRREPGLPLDALIVHARRAGADLSLRCGFEGFPLVCTEVSP